MGQRQGNSPDGIIEGVNHDGPSRTALGAATHRAAHQVLDDARIFRDRLAVPILPDAQMAIEEAEAHPERRRLRLFIAGRHRIFEDLAEQQSTLGPAQVVVLGAGLDTFPYRHAATPDLHVWEVDHPASQAWKRIRLADAGIPVPGNLDFVGVDFETDDLAAELEKAGVDRTLPVVFGWLGVVPYLTRAAITQTLEVIADLPGALAVFDYANPTADLAEQSRRRRQDDLARVAAVGEPWISFFDTEELHAVLRRRGLAVIEDLGPADFGARFFGLPAGPQRPGGHILVARGPTPGRGEET